MLAAVVVGEGGGGGFPNDAPEGPDKFAIECQHQDHSTDEMDHLYRRAG